MNAAQSTAHSSSASPNYLAIIGDLVHSRDIPNREQFQQQFHQTMADLNQKFQQAITSPFTVTLGDEFQALLHDATPLFAIIDHLKTALQPHAFVLGLGVGKVETAISRTTSVGMDGPCFRLARKNVERSKKKPPRIRLSVAGLDTEVVNALLHFLEDIQNHHTPRQQTVVYWYERLGNQQAVARQLGISQSAVSQILQSARYPLMMRSRKAIVTFINQFLNPSSPTEY